MAAKLIFVICLVVVASVAVLGAPKPLSTDADLKKSVIEFLKQDKEFVQELAKMKSLGNSGSDLSSRHRRQAETEEVDTDSIEDQQPGFFDRAAKFIVDLLQRFLKWVNSDSN